MGLTLGVVRTGGGEGLTLGVVALPNTAGVDELCEFAPLRHDRNGGFLYGGFVVLVDVDELTAAGCGAALDCAAAGKGLALGVIALPGGD